MKVFISYAREDQAQAERVYEYLSSLSGIQPWMDIHDIFPGADWEYEITQALNESDFVLLLLSRNSVNKKGYIQKEVKNALDLYEAHPPGDIYLIPVRLEDCTPKHIELNKLNWVDLFSDWDYGLERVKKVIKGTKDKSIGSNDFKKTNSFDTYFIDILEKGRQFSGAEFAKLFIVKHEQLILKMVTPKSQQSDMDLYTLPKETISNQPFLTKKSIYIPDVNNEPQYEKMVTEENLEAQSILTVPIINKFEENVLGVITLGHNDPYAFDKQTQDFIEIFANQVSIAIRNFRFKSQMKNLREIDKLILSAYR